jgi:hypothetical protein
MNLIYSYGKKEYMGKLNYEGIKSIYDNYKEQKKAESDENAENTCADLHEPTNECCGYEYMQEWDSACFIMDELKESKCLALEEDRTLSSNTDGDCSSGRQIWNSVAGFCEPDGKAPKEIVPAYDTFKKKETLEQIPGYAESEEGEKVIRIAGDVSNSVYFRFVPEDYIGSSFGADTERNVYTAEIGFVTSDIKSAQENYEVGRASMVSSNRVFMPIEYQLFRIDVSTSNEKDSLYIDKRTDFAEKYKNVVGSDKKIGERVYKRLQEYIGFSEKEYIVDPTSGLLRSIQCVCLPGITSYLNLWKRVLEAVKVCFETVLVTGDGSAGVCKAVLSTYVCDLIYDLISCFQNKYGSGFKREEKGGGIGNFFGALTSAGNKVSNSVTQRYGQSTIYKTMFAEKKLVHSVCLWAFTGTWDFDVASVLEEDISIDVNTVAFLYPCTRRFVTFNPGTNPPGITTYNYHVGLGMVAGSQMNYNVELICSDDYSCDTPDGRCDCAEIGKQTFHLPMGPGTATRGQTIEDEQFINIEGVNRNHRYDKAIVKWNSDDSSKNGQVECDIKDVGGEAPAFCKLEAGEGRFVCSLGFDDQDYIKFYSDPTPTKSAYTIGDNLFVNIKLTQKQPTVSSGVDRNEYTKYLKIDLFNKYGENVYESQYYPLNGNGLHQFNDLPTYQLKKADFGRKKGTVSASGGPVLSIVLKDKNSVPVHQDIYLKFKDDSGNFDVTKYEGIGDNRKLVPVSYPEGQTTAKNFGATDWRIFLDTYNMKLSRKPKKDETIHVTYTAPGSSGDTCTTELQQWKLHVALYDSAGNTYDPSDVFSYSGEKQEKEIKIAVRCQQGSSSETICPANELVTKECKCGTSTCTPDTSSAKTPVYCNWYGSEGKCENTVKKEEPTTETKSSEKTEEQKKAEALAEIDKIFEDIPDVNVNTKVRFDPIELMPHNPRFMSGSTKTKGVIVVDHEGQEKKQPYKVVDGFVYGYTLKENEWWKYMDENNNQIDFEQTETRAVFKLE